MRSWKSVFLESLAFEHGTLLCMVVLFLPQGRGLSSYTVNLAGTFLSFWVLEKHVRPLHLGSAPLITEGGRTWGARKLGAPGLQNEANF